MPTYRLRLLLAIALCAVLLSMTGCGNKGDLVRPSAESAAQE